MSAVINEQVIAPIGWGFQKGANLVGPAPVLPDLPLLHLLGPGRITPTIRAAIEQVPELIPSLTARQLQDKYGIGRSIAFDVLNSLRA